MLNSTEERNTRGRNIIVVQFNRGKGSRQREISRKSRTSFLLPFHCFFLFVNLANRFHECPSRVSQFALDYRPVAAVCIHPCLYTNPCGLLYRLPIGWARFRPERRGRNFSANILALIGAIGRRSAIITYRVRKIISRRVTGTPRLAYGPTSRIMDLFWCVIPRREFLVETRQFVRKLIALFFFNL